MSSNTLQISVIFPADDQTIKSEIAKINAEIGVRQQEINILRQAIQGYVSQCSHKGQKTGYNERDGSWGNPCPTCGYSY